MMKSAQDDQLNKGINMYIVRNFFLLPYNITEDFYEQFQERLVRAKYELGVEEEDN
jgi:hypothetical protein